MRLGVDVRLVLVVGLGFVVGLRLLGGAYA